MSETTTTPSDAGMSAESALIAASQANASTDVMTGAEGSSDKSTTDTQSGSESVDTSTSEDTTATTDADLAWLTNKGVDVNDPKAVAAAWRKAEQEFHKTRQESKASQSIQEQVTQDDTVAAYDSAAGLDPEVVQLKRDVAEMRFFSAHPDITPENREQVTADIVEAAKKYPLLASAFDLETLYAIAKSQKIAVVEQTAEARGRKTKSEEISRASGAVIPEGEASGGKKAESVNPFLQGFNG